MTQLYSKFLRKEGFSQSHLKVIEIVGRNKIVLELGSSSGYMTKVLKENGCRVDIVEIDKDDAKKAKKFARNAFVGSLEDDRVFERITGEYDAIVMADVLEHIKDPQNLLNKIKNNLKKKKGKLVVSIPNIACWSMRRDLFFKGSFDYQDRGLLDRTHLRFYTYYSIQQLLINSGYKIINIFSLEIEYPFRKSLLKIEWLGKRIDRRIREWISKRYPNFSTYHLVIEAERKD